MQCAGVYRKVKGRRAFAASLLNAGLGVQSRKGAYGRTLAIAKAILNGTKLRRKHPSNLQHQ